ncbi:MAG: leucyl aminopeptidase family protein [Planctomycetes bacterium]|nr:leucyl aminopeptidase family protein [Planctomycetota bacterium]
MSTVQYAKSIASALRGTATLIVAGPPRLLRERGPALGAIPEPFASLVLDIATELRTTDLGERSVTRTGSHPAQLHVVQLPATVSRHNAPSRAEALRRAVREIAPRGRVAVVVLADDATHALPLAVAVGRAIPLVDRKSRTNESGPLRIAIVGPDGKPLKIAAELSETVDATRAAARLVDLPPSELTPGVLAREARALLRGLEHVSIREVRGDKLLDEGLGGIHAVGRCATDAPRMLIASYRPPGAGSGHVALVGKGVTYDTGGLHLKARGSMETMKADMGGAAAVLGAFRVHASTHQKRRVTLVLCLAENAIGPAAYKPDDVLTLHSGKTVEINNTDAEGRLLLADGVSYAARVLGADTIFDAATLTGAQLIATGLNHAAIVTNDEELERAAIAAGQRSGDLVHPLPFAPEFHRSEFASPIADMRNSVKNRSNAQSSCAAAFIHWHLPESPEPRWLHVDLAGPAFREDRGTGFGVALLADLLRTS